MTMKHTALLLASCLLLAATASAHTAAPPRSHEARLLHDCNDDYYGSDAFGGQDGHELHALDVFEAWDEALGNIVTFRLTLAGEGPGTIDLSLKAGSASKTYQWSTTGAAWSGTFDEVEGPFQAKRADGTPDGDRLVLHGIVKQSKLGSDGTRLTDYVVQSSVDGDDADAMPGYDGGITGSCSDEFQRPDYRLAGPIQYADLTLERSSVTLDVDQEVFLQVTATNKLRDQAQRVTISPTAEAGVDVEMHNPDTNAYDDELTLDLNKKDGGGDAKIAHVAITGTEPGSEGTVTVEVTTSAGGRLVKTFTFRVAQEAEPTPIEATPTGTDSPEQPPDGNDAPGAGIMAIVAALAAALILRRR